MKLKKSPGPNKRAVDPLMKNENESVINPLPGNG
jgi:hypothetical protein